MGRRVVIDDKLEVIDVKSTSTDGGGNEDVEGPVLEVH